MKATFSEYDNFRWINCNRWSNAKEVDALVDLLVQEIPSRKKDGYRINMKVLVLDLYQSYLCDTEQYIAYSRDKNLYSMPGSDHPYIKNPRITYERLIECVDVLVAKRLIRNKKGAWFGKAGDGNGPSFVSRMRPLGQFMDLVGQYQITPEMIGAYIEDEVLVLRGAPVNGVKPKLKVPKNNESQRMARLIRQYNTLLERTHIDVDVECMTYKDRDELVAQLADMNVPGRKRIILKLSNKSVYRVFNNGSLKQGGRFYGGWWISAPSIVRKYITINGDPTVELDFSAMHIHLLYAKVGINYADKGVDAYTLELGPYSLRDERDDRDLNKLILLTAFNAKTPTKAASAVFNELRKEGKLYQYQVRDHKLIKAKLDLLKKKHPHIASLVANDYGRELQYYDSCVVEKVISYFIRKGIPVLTVHDSVICQVQHADTVMNVMYNAFYQTADELLNINVKPTWKYKLVSYITSLLNKQYITPPTRWYPNMLRLDTKIKPIYKGQITDTIPSTLNIKPTNRTNTCSKQCKHEVRLHHKLKFNPNIKLELKNIVESYTNVLVIR
ncbi:hypothetical protein KP005_04965 [Geomonas nitrogeniifigens]|uniref:DNA-directed RNA polymerase n=1 Tax=Geomonas diazotrophica TaxID=2843197 RepID=A0ABX8JNA4_9BACT|nr:hypothetical protein [Geomonas nitrogeniifigens]QWV98641.1 hypothetical protein KP005_04965 [Geomonas nitrogeniifigens]